MYNLKDKDKLTFTGKQLKERKEKIIAETKKEFGEKFVNELYKLNWIKIMDTAIKARKTSWNDSPIREWRNASDEVNSAVVNALREHLKLRNNFQIANDEINKVKGFLTERNKEMEKAVDEFILDELIIPLEVRATSVDITNRRMFEDDYEDWLKEVRIKLTELKSKLGLNKDG